MVKTLVESVPKPDTAATYSWFWMCWRILSFDTGYNSYLCGFYDIFINVFITIAYPLHLIIGLFMNPTLSNVSQNLSISVTCTACTIKHYILRYKLKDIKAIEQKLCQLDQSVVDMDERKFFNDVPRVQSKRVVQLFFTAFILADVSATATTLLRSERRLMFPAWFPFDVTSSTLLYYLALGYQFSGVSMQIVQNLSNNVYTPISLAVVGGHVRLLGMRIAKIGYDSRKSEKEYRKDLVSCIKDHQTLIEILRLLQSTIYFGQLVQFLASGLIICFTLVCLLFYADSFFAYVYYAEYLFSMGLEIFPCCYFGSLLEQELSNLTYTIFNSNWLTSTPQYRKELIIFMQLTLKDIKLRAGGFIGINLNAFFGTCQMAYSIFTVILRTK